MLTIGFIDYINAYPFTAAFRKEVLKADFTIHYEQPTTLNRLLREGNLDISQVSSIEFLQGDYALLPGFCIAAHKQILSVNLYSKKDLSSLKKIEVTPESATSVELLKILCKHLWRISPTFEVLKNSSDSEAFLLIGDEALKKREIQGYQTIDLAQCWYQMTGLPFVFSVFAICKQALLEKKQNIESFARKVEAALNWGENNPQDIITLANERTCLPSPLLQEYFRLCKYRLGKKEKEGLECFKSYVSEKRS